MTRHTSAKKKPPVRFERRYEAQLEDLWDLWTTKEGFESWWGPEGFRVEVHSIDPRPGGELVYDMIAALPEHIEYLKKEGMPPSHATRGQFVAVEPLKRLQIRHMIDFIPGLAPYSNDIDVEFVRDGSTVIMVVAIERHPDEEWTSRAAAGFESQLRKLPLALATR